MAAGAMVPAEFILKDDMELCYTLKSFSIEITVVIIAGPDRPFGGTVISISGHSMGPPLLPWSPAKSAGRFLQTRRKSVSRPKCWPLIRPI